MEKIEENEPRKSVANIIIMTSPMQRSLKYLKKEGYVCEITEHYNQFSKRRVDLLGVIDLIALKKGVQGVTGIQTSTMSNKSAHKKKILESEEAKLFVECGNTLILHSWRKLKKGKVCRWQVDEEEITF